MRFLREDNFSQYIIPKMPLVKPIQQKRDKFNQKMRDNCYYRILKEQDLNVFDLPIRDLQKLLKHRS